MEITAKNYRQTPAQKQIITSEDVLLTPSRVALLAVQRNTVYAWVKRDSNGVAKFESIRLPGNKIRRDHIFGIIGGQI